MSVNVSSLEGIFKYREGEKVRAVPSFVKLAKDAKFKASTAKLGRKFIYPVVLRRPQGFTYAGSTSGGTSYTLNPARGMVSQEAEAEGSEVTLQEDIAYKTISAGGGGAQSFGDTMDEIVFAMEESMDLRLEMDLLYGQSDLGVIESVTGSGTDRAWVLTKASWIAGLWDQLENATLDAYDTVGGTKVNTNAEVVVDSVDHATRTVNVTGNSTDLTAIAAADVLVFEGTDGEQMVGLDSLSTNTGTILGIPGGTYSLWTGNTTSAANERLTLGKVHEAINQSHVRGLSGKVKVVTSTYAFVDISEDLSALRRFSDKNQMEYKSGADAIEFYGVHGGSFTLEPHPLIKAGEAFYYQPSNLFRIGSTEPTFRLQGPDGFQDHFLQQLEGSNGIRVRRYCDQALMAKKLSCLGKITNIVNNSL